MVLDRKEHRMVPHSKEDSDLTLAESPLSAEIAESRSGCNG